MNIEINGLVADHVQEILLGEGFMQRYDFTWYYDRCEMVVGGEVHKLFNHERGGYVRKISVKATVEIPSRSEATVLDKTAYRAPMAPSRSALASQPSYPVPDIFVAQTLLPDRCRSANG